MTWNIWYMDDLYDIYTLLHIDYTFRTCHLLKKWYKYCTYHM